MNRVRMLTAAMILGLAPIACAGPMATSDEPSSQPPTGEPAAAMPSADPALAAAKVTGEALPRDPTADEMREGKHFAFLKAMAPGATPMLVVNPAVMFDGEEGEAASLADGARTAESGLPNGFYIRDLDAATVTLPVSVAAVVTLTVTADLKHDMSASPVTVGDLAGWFAGTPIAPPADRTWLDFWGDPAAATKIEYEAPFWITTLAGTVVELEQQYLP